MAKTTRARLTLAATSVVTLGAAVAALSLSVTHRDPAPLRAAPSVAPTCAAAPYAGDADVILDLSQAVQQIQTVRVHTGQTLGIGGTAGCDLHRFPPAASTGPLLQEMARHTAAGGDVDVEYRAVQAGTVTLPLCTGSCVPATAVVTVLPPEDPAVAALRGTGTITLTADNLAGTYPLQTVDCPRRVHDGTVDAGPAFRFTARGVSYGGSVNAGIRAAGAQLSRPTEKGNVVFGVGTPPHEPIFLIELPRFGTLTVDDGGGTLTASPLYADATDQDWGTVALTWHC
jgi:hypothetical protein